MAVGRAGTGAGCEVAQGGVLTRRGDYGILFGPIVSTSPEARLAFLFSPHLPQVAASSMMEVVL